MSDIFTKLLDEQEKQQKQVSEVKAREQNKELAPQDNLAQKDAQQSEQVSKPLSKDKSPQSKVQERPRENKISLPSAEAIETMAFQLRKTRKTKVNTEIAEEWKEELDEITFQLKVGKYELLEYIIGSFLEKVGEK